MGVEVDLAICVAHPDDECLGFGAWMAQTIQGGGSVAVFIATAGDASTYGALSPDEVGTLRLNESTEALRTLGVDAPYCPKLPDGRLETEIDSLAAALQDWLLVRRPRRVATFGLDGAYGHRDHLAVTRTLLSLQTRLDVELWQTIFPPNTFDELRRYLKRNAPSLLSPDAEHPGEVHPQLVIEDAELLALKKNALSAYRSQLGGRGVEQFLGKRTMQTLLNIETFAPLASETPKQ